MKNNELNDRRLQATPRGIGVMCNFYADKAENATVWDVEGNEYIDFAAGIAVLNTGHRHPKVISAIEKQLHAFTHTAYQIVPYEGYVTLAERINQRVPVDGPAKTAFFSTGAEAVENAVKIARAATGRPGAPAADLLAGTLPDHRRGVRHRVRKPQPQGAARGFRIHARPLRLPPRIFLAESVLFSYFCPFVNMQTCTSAS